MNNAENEESIKIKMDEAFDELCDALSRTDDKAFIKQFLNDLFTESEYKSISKRWLLVKEIQKGTTQREIAKMFNVSLCKITRGSRELKKENSSIKKMLEK